MGARMKTLEEKKEELKKTMEMLEKGVGDVFTSDKFTQYLNTMSKFHNYSVKNILWLQMQNPYASHIAGMKTWNKLGRKINKGEKSLRVLAPYKHKKEIEMDKLKPNTNKAYVDSKGNPIKEKQQVEWISFKAVPVFDISQTNGKELPTLIDELDGNVNNYEYMKSSLIDVAKIPVEFEKIESGSKGYYHLKENRIAIKEGMSEQQTIKTMVHEITHSRLHSMAKQDNIKDTTERNTKEIEAESVAFVVSKHFGINTEDYSFGYIASWSKGKDLKELESSLNTIQKEANSIISGVEEKLENKLNKDKTIDKEPNDKKPYDKEVSCKTPFVEIVFSEVEEKAYFKEGEKISFNKANTMFKEAEKEVRYKKETAKENGDYYPYLKTKFILNIDHDNKTTMRYDIGDGFADDLKDFCKKELNKTHENLLEKSYFKTEIPKDNELER